MGFVKLHHECNEAKAELVKANMKITELEATKESNGRKRHAKEELKIEFDT